MSRLPEPILTEDAAPAGRQLYHCGPLTYTKFGLGMLFAWLLWGDFCFTLMEDVVPPLMPLKLKALGASNTLMSLILGVLPAALNMTIVPWVSFASDRYRSRWGRRIPFILKTMPFLTLSLIMLGWSEKLAPLVQRAIPALADVAPATVTIALISFFYVVFQFFNMFVNSVFWYLFNDVVPPQFLGRFTGLFRIVASGVTVLYHYFIFQHSETHMREILTGAALLYFFGFGLMCLRVKEGPYPPPPDTGRPKGLLGGLKAFGEQSFSARFYWYFYLGSMFGAIAGASGMFQVFFSQQMGLTLDQIGQLNAYSFAAAFVATYLTAVFVDRWHPLRVMTYLAVFTAVSGFGGWVWVAVTLPANVYFLLALGGMLVTRFGQTLREACGLPLFMRLMPKSLYGQFGSANAVLSSLGRIVGNLLAGLCLDGVRLFYQGTEDFAYRWVFLWPWIFGCANAVFLCLGYREWKRLGGDENYRPPAPWTPEGFEEVADKVQSVPARPRAVMVSMWLSVAGIAFNILLVLAFMYLMHRYQMSRSLLWYARVFLPIKLLLTGLAYAQLRQVRRDIAARERGESTRMGVPHHGVLLVNAIQGLVAFPVFWYQMVKVIELGMQRELIVFGIASLLSTAGTILGVQILRWIERADLGADTRPRMKVEASTAAGTKMQPLPQSLLGSRPASM